MSSGQLARSPFHRAQASNQSFASEKKIRHRTCRKLQADARRIIGEPPPVTSAEINRINKIDQRCFFASGWMVVGGQYNDPLNRRAATRGIISSRSRINILRDMFAAINNLPSTMGVGKIFSRGALGDFSRGGAKSGEIWFFPLETRKTTFLLKISKSRRAWPPFRHPCLTPKISVRRRISIVQPNIKTLFLHALSTFRWSFSLQRFCNQNLINFFYSWFAWNGWCNNPTFRRNILSSSSTLFIETKHCFENDSQPSFSAEKNKWFRSSLLAAHSS